MGTFYRLVTYWCAKYLLSLWTADFVFYSFCHLLMKKRSYFIAPKLSTFPFVASILTFFVRNRRKVSTLPAPPGGSILQAGRLSYLVDTGRPPCWWGKHKAMRGASSRQTRAQLHLITSPQPEALVPGQTGPELHSPRTTRRHQMGREDREQAPPPDQAVQTGTPLLAGFRQEPGTPLQRQLPTDCGCRSPSFSS